MPTFDITRSDQILDHGLGTRDLIVQGWQNGHLVSPDVYLHSDNEIRVFTLGVSESNPMRLIVLAVPEGGALLSQGDPKLLFEKLPDRKLSNTEGKSSASEEKPKRRRVRKAKDS